ncbi:hypothetical protein A9404_01285 [Halothiobacillus diazotrophicus]|uniref:GGDEF domain-containing protein n=1 Tax=Halothiobacillus diazotrophicus TaxID=1860122 RepID=A0A191ZE86_9GAMM|nr:sensor domain-containing diguanylate cyclase [Halothiobacillus diazotrophicus]ANJ66186.1 hypothetical protein A9404_01285 [Halothiobacillus diazotrophicus]
MNGAVRARNSESNLLTPNTNLLDARPTRAEMRLTWVLIGGLMAALVLVLPIAHIQWPASNLLYSLAGISAFAQIATGVLLLTQALILRNDSVLILSVGYLTGGLVVASNVVLVHDTALQLWVFRIWHSVFVLAILGYALLQSCPEPLLARRRFRQRVKAFVAIGIGFVTLLGGYIVFRPFELPLILQDTNYATPADIWVNVIQMILISVAWICLVRNRRKTVLSIWMAVVAAAVFVDIILFIVGGKLFSVGLYISKLNNLIAVTLIFYVIFYHYVRIQHELLRNRVWLMRANRRLNRKALSDPLTTLPNRAALEAYLNFALGRAERHKGILAVCVIDLDEFKPVNDRYGHEVGDQLLNALAKRLSGTLRMEEFLARLGGDEFVLVLEGVENISTLNVIMERISDEIARPFVLQDGIHVQVHASIGIATYPEIKTADELMRMADRALYRAKNEKKSRSRNWQLHLLETPTG